MKRLICCFAFLVLLLGSLSAQEKCWYSLTQDTRFSRMPGEESVFSMAFAVAPGCTFANGLSLRLPLDVEVFMSQGKLIKTYEQTGTLGLGVGYNLVDGQRSRLELSLAGGSTYIRTSMNYAYADLGLRYGAKYFGKVTPYMSIGGRYLSYYKSTDLKDQMGIYLTFGIWFF